MLFVSISNHDCFTSCAYLIEFIWRVEKYTIVSKFLDQFLKSFLNDVRKAQLNVEVVNELLKKFLSFEIYEMDNWRSLVRQEPS